jgi:hypothetical protein
MDIHRNTPRFFSAVTTSVLLYCVAMSASAQQINPNNLPLCPESSKKRDSCWGQYFYVTGGKWIGEIHNNKPQGWGTFVYPDGSKYVGEFSRDSRNGQGVFSNGLYGSYLEGDWKDDNLVVAKTIRFGKDSSEKQSGNDSKLASPPRDSPTDKESLRLEVSNTEPASDGSFTISVRTNADTASLIVDGREEGGRKDGNYTIRRVARAGQESLIKIVATDVYGNSESKTLSVSRRVIESASKYAQLNPTLIRPQPAREAVAIIIGITDYRSLPKAEFANDDARVFYDYAIRALGVKPENIKLLVDADAEEVEIIKTFKAWLPSRVKTTTDVYLFYSGHGLPTQDGQSLYLLPPRADRDFISRTSIQFQEISADIQAAKPKSVTIFMDACYSGQARSGETLVANARPVTLKAEKKLFPDNFTVITASQADQISSSSPDLKHGIFSYYLMKGMEGDADANKDGKITLGEMQAYLEENVGRHAGMMSRKQEPQLVGDAGRVLVGK